MLTWLSSLPSARLLSPAASPVSAALLFVSSSRSAFAVRWAAPVLPAEPPLAGLSPPPVSFEAVRLNSGQSFAEFDNET